MLKKSILLLSILLLLCTSQGLAAPASENAMLSIALYIDTSGHYVPGIDLLNKALNEVISYKATSLFLSNQVLSGSEVLRDLNDYGINNNSSATITNLSSYAANTHVKYVILFTVHPLDVSLDLKAFSAASNNYLVDKTITRPENSQGSVLDTFTTMITNELTQIFHTIQP